MTDGSLCVRAGCGHHKDSHDGDLTNLYRCMFPGCDCPAMAWRVPAHGELGSYILERRDDGMCRVRLVPIEIFGQECDHPAHEGEPEPFGYGLCDAVSAWSDCNRAVGHMFRLDEGFSAPYRRPDDVVEIWVHEDELPKFLRHWPTSDDLPPTLVVGRAAVVDIRAGENVVSMSSSGAVDTSGVSGISVSWPSS